MKLNAEWITGFVDGEGCFHVSVNSHKEMSVGYQVLPEFTVVQHKRDAKLLEALKSFFKCGVVRVNHGDRLAFRVRSLKDLASVIVPFFKKYPLNSTKKEDFESFCKALSLIQAGEHLTDTGIKKIRTIKSQMNRGKLR